MVQQFDTQNDALDAICSYFRIYGDNVLGEVQSTVDDIINNVKSSGDAALLQYTQQFDKSKATSVESLRVSQSAIDQAYANADPELISAMELAASRITAYHKKQMPRDFRYHDEQDIELGNIWKAVGRAGIYVPGGLASYPSSVLMNALPAITAGVKEITMVVPSPEDTLNPVVLAAAKICGISEIYTIGGAQAVAALALGTETIKPVDIIVGPGNRFVAAAKKTLYGTVGIDMIAGPSEILVVADNQTPASWTAADLLSQAEHDEAARSILITNDHAYAKQVAQAVHDHLNSLSRRDIASKSWDNHGAIIVDHNFAHTVKLIDAIAPEHLELSLDDALANQFASELSNAGAVFLGRYTPEAIGDYMAGPSHVLPTSSTARFSSGLSVYDFLKRVSFIGCSQAGFANIADATVTFAEAEGLDAHALSVKLRNQ